MIRNSENQYGLTSIAMHWVSALVVFGLFGLGFWMVELTYYSSWYKTAPDIHKSLGVLLFVATLIRLIWGKLNPKPKALAHHKVWEQRIGALVHQALYLLLLSIMVSGYLISTADDRGIEVFGWFEVPSLGLLFDDQADLAGLVHQYFAYSLMGLVLLHALGAMKHHFIDKDLTLIRMTRIKEIK
ncbi:cytochrome b [Shewanella colwelliana]|uniref:cytochrome b n=1 Tax=Shewanella colwelliana TaxID=23 RepID=UPI003735831B